MRFIRYALAASMLTALAGCPDKDKHSSIELMNAGIEAFKSSNYSQAIEHFKDATSKYPGNHQAWYSLGQVYGEKGEWDKAADAFEEAIRGRSDDPMYQHHLGMALYEQGNVEGAREPLEKAVELNSDIYRAWWYLGRVYRDLDMPQKAAEAWSKAITVNPYDGWPFTALGQLYILWDMIPQAISVLEQGAQTVKGPEEKTNVYQTLGLAYDAQQKYDESIDAYRKALELSGDNKEANFQLGIALFEAEKKEDALEELENYIAKADPKKDAFNVGQARKKLNQLLMEDAEQDTAQE